jgi:hypothetical protein
LSELFLGSHLVALLRDGTLAPDQARQWWKYLEEADEHVTLLISFTAFIVVGAKQ